MKRQAINLMAIMLVASMVFSCSNKELESRVATLEGKVAELSGEKQPDNKPAISERAPLQSQPTEEEVKPEGPLPVFEFPEENFDFGTINEGDKVEHTFKFTNVGEAPLIISSATASCGCTVPEWPKEPIAVGADGEIKVRFDSKNKPGIQNKTITITANTYPKISRLKIKANVNKKEEDPS